MPGSLEPGYMGYIHVDVSIGKVYIPLLFVAVTSNKQRLQTRLYVCRIYSGNLQNSQSQLNSLPQTRTPPRFLQDRAQGTPSPRPLTTHPPPSGPLLGSNCPPLNGLRI